MGQPLMNKNELQDERAWIEAAKQDPEAFRHLFNKYHDRIYNFVLRRMYYRVLAQDITASAFMKAFKNIKQFQYKGIPFSAWLYRIAINEINLHHRKRKRTVPLTPERSLHLAHESRTDDAIIKSEDDAEKKKRFKKIHEAIGTLKPKYQNAIALRYFEDKSIREIAEILDLSENTVKTHIHRALHQLRELL